MPTKKWLLRLSLLLLVAGGIAGFNALRPRAVKVTAGEYQQLAVKYALDIVTTDPPVRVATAHGPIDCMAVSSSELAAYTPLFLFEFDLYPPELVRRTGLRTVVLCKELAFAGQKRTAVPDFENNRLFLDIARAMYDETYMRKVLHHEFFHIIDYKDDGLLYEDERWSALNPGGFKYGTGGKNAQDDATVSVVTNRFPGFINRYATTGVEEDKAEIFANMMVGIQELERMARKDRVLRSKMQRMQELLQSFCPQVGPEFWNRVRGLDRPAPDALGPRSALPVACPLVGVHAA